MARMTPCLHTRLSFSNNGLGSNEEEEEIPKCRNSSRSGCLELYTHIYIYISSSSSSLNRLLRKRSVPANCNSDSAGRNSRLPEILQASSEGIPGAKLSSCRSNEEISSESRIRTSIFEDFSASCFPNSRCAKIQDPASFWIGRESFLWIWLTTGWLEQG